MKGTNNMEEQLSTLVVAEGSEENQYAFAIGVTKITIERILKLKTHRADALALYLFYAYTARWQYTNEVWANNEYTRQRLGWGIDKVKHVKKVLRQLGLISESKAIRGEKGRAKKWLIKVNYFVTTGLVSQPVVKPATYIEEVLGTRTKKNNLAECEEIWRYYPRKAGKPAAIRAIAKAINRVGFDRLRALTMSFASVRPNKNDSYTPWPQRWFNEERYNDDPVTWEPKRQRPSAMSELDKRLASDPLWQEQERKRKQGEL
jgi:hypothetical protein